MSPSAPWPTMDRISSCPPPQCGSDSSEVERSEPSAQGRCNWVHSGSIRRTVRHRATCRDQFVVFAPSTSPWASLYTGEAGRSGVNRAAFRTSAGLSCAQLCFPGPDDRNGRPATQFSINSPPTESDSCDLGIAQISQPAAGSPLQSSIQRLHHSDGLPVPLRFAHQIVEGWPQRKD
jgi:hypothetical protein